MSLELLLVDDEEKIGELAAKRLESRGYLAHRTTSGKEALQFAAEKPELAVAILDMRMPGMDGLELVHKLREVRPDMEFIMVSAYGTPLCRMECKRWGVRAFLDKPVDIERLIEAVEEAGKARESRLAKSA